MKNSDAIKTLLFAAINEIAADPSKYAVNPGKVLLGCCCSGLLLITLFDLVRLLYT